MSLHLNLLSFVHAVVPLTIFVTHSMTLISQPWNHPTSQLVIAGSDDAMARSISFLGPMLLGSLVWDMCVTDLAAMLSAIPGHATRRKQSQAWARYRREAFYRKAEGNWSKLPFAQQKRSQLVRKATFMLSFLARATALCMLALYLAYTQGDRGMRCTVWPRAIIGLGAGVGERWVGLRLRTQTDSSTDTFRPPRSSLPAWYSSEHFDVLDDLFCL